MSTESELTTELRAALRAFLRNHDLSATRCRNVPTLDRALQISTTPEAVFHLLLVGVGEDDAKRFWPTFWDGWQSGRAYREEAE